MTATEQPINIKAAAWTIGVHALLLLLFLLFRYSMPVQMPVEELGMEVNLGTDEDGSGTDQPMNIDAPAAIATPSASTASAAPSDNSQELMESDDPDAPSISTPTNTPAPANTHHTNTVPAHNTQPANTSEKNNTPRQQPKYVYSGGTGGGGNNAASNAPGTSEGNTAGHGDRGVPGGTPGASNYTGSPGNGTGGISHTLTGRDISPKRFEAEFSEGGKVVVKVTVDKTGNIISKSIKSSPSRTLSNLALQKLSQAKFSPNKDAAPQQFGEITIVFKTR